MVRRIHALCAVPVLAAALWLLVSSSGSDAGVTCWTKGTAACSTCGLTARCTTRVCTAGTLTWYCPSGTSENVRLVAAGTTVPACGNPVVSGFTCVTSGPTTWCTESVPCDSGCTGVLDPMTGTVTFFCDPPTVGPTGTGSKCGLAAAVFGTPCPPPGS